MGYIAKKCIMTSLTKCNKNCRKENTSEELVYVLKLQFDTSLNLDMFQCVYGKCLLSFSGRKNYWKGATFNLVNDPIL